MSVPTGEIGTWWGVDVITTPALQDGKVLLASNFLVIGTGKLTPIEEARREARRIVRRGLADVLRWCGETVDLEPGSVEILEAMRREWGVRPR